MVFCEIKVLRFHISINGSFILHGETEMLFLLGELKIYPPSYQTLFHFDSCLLLFQNLKGISKYEIRLQNGSSECN